MFLSDPSALSKLQSRPAFIRNICILAHVDHGKTTLSDYLLSSNGVISRALAGKVRYLDSRADEQERQITMKSSSIALVFQDKRLSDERERVHKHSLTSTAQPPTPSPIPSPAPSSSPAADASSSAPPVDPVYLINLIDSPGHVDFSSEVSTAVRSSDGALVLVDVIEGLCVQTSAVLRQAWREGVRPVLVLNKLDRLIVEVKMSAAEAYAHCFKLVETINAVASTFITSDAAMTAATADSASTEVDIDDDKQVIFSPEKGNVLFASAHDCWAFSLHDFARLYARLLGMKEAALQQCMWGEFYYLARDKKVVRKPTAKQSKVMCVQFVFEVVWQVYAAVLGEDEGAEKVIAMMDRLGVTLTARELSREKERKRRLQLVMQKWLPISSCVLGCVVDQLPSPAEAQKERLERVWSGEARRREGEEELREAMGRCDQRYPEVMVYVSKMVDYGQVLGKMRERAKQGAAVRGIRRAYVKGKAADAGESKEDEEQNAAAEEERKDGEDTVAPIESTSDSRRFLGFTRVFAGTLTTSSDSQVLHVYLPRYHPSSPLHHLTIPSSSLSLYLFMGVDLQPVTSVPAGCVCGIAGLDAVVLKAATLSTLPPPLSPFSPLSFQSAPIMRVALEPDNANDFPTFRAGLSLLQHADPNVVVTETERGETVLIVSGELHLERCVRDLKDRFAVGVGVRVSEPLVAFREGVVREGERVKDEVDFRAKKEKEKERKVKEKTRGKKKGGGEDEEDEAAAVKEGDRKRAKDAEERKRREREKEREEKSDATLSVEAEREREREPLREAAASPLPSVDEESSQHLDTASSLDPADKAARHRHEVEEWTANRGVMIRVRCVPLGPDVMKLLEEGRSVIKRMARKRHREEAQLRKTTEDAAAAAKPANGQAAGEVELKAAGIGAESSAQLPPDSQGVEVTGEGEEAGDGVNEEVEDDAQDEDDLIASRSRDKYSTTTFLSTLRSLFGSPSCPDLSADDVGHIWSFGPKRYGPNLLINRTDTSPLTSFIAPLSSSSPTSTSTLDPTRLSIFRGVETGLVNGFQLATSAGPICEEPMMGVAFIVTALTLHAPAPSGSVISSSRSACRRSFLTHQHHLRLLEAVYLVHLQCSTAELGHLYPVLARRRGRIVGEDLQEGTNLFLIVAYLPLAESFGFSSEVRKATGGEAQPQLIFSHWELMAQDPFYQPRTEEDIERTGVVEEGRNVSREWMDKVKKRKGLFVEKVVEHAEKQRTLARKK